MRSYWDRSSRVIGKQIHQMLPAGAPVPVYPDTIGLFDAAVFYTDRPTVHLENQERLQAHLDRPAPRLFVTDDWQLGRIAKNQELAPLIHILFREGDKVIATNPAGWRERKETSVRPPTTPR